MACKSGKIRRTTKKYGGIDRDEIEQEIKNAATRIVKPVRITAHGL